MPQAYENTGTATRYIFKLAERQLASSPVVADLLNNLSSREFFLDQPMEIIVGLCPKGLREIKRVNLSHLRQTLVALNINPSAPLYFVSYEDLKGFN